MIIGKVVYLRVNRNYLFVFLGQRQDLGQKPGANHPLAVILNNQGVNLFYVAADKGEDLFPQIIVKGRVFFPVHPDYLLMMGDNPGL